MGILYTRCIGTLAAKGKYIFPLDNDDLFLVNDTIDMTRLVLWGQCIKTKLYQKAINAYGKKRYSKYVTFYEDGIINFIILQFAKTAKLFVKYGILHIFNPSSAGNNVNQIKKLTYEIYYTESIFEFSRNTTYTKLIVVTKLIQLMNKKYFFRTINKKNNKEYFESLIEKIISSKYINNSMKILLKKESLKFKINIK